MKLIVPQGKTKTHEGIVYHQGEHEIGEAVVPEIKVAPVHEIPQVESPAESAEAEGE